MRDHSGVGIWKRAVAASTDTQSERSWEKTAADGLTILSPINSGLEQLVKVAIEAGEESRLTLAVVRDTPGGVVEVVERVVRVLRHHYDEVKFVIPDRGMSAGTVLAMSG